MKNYQQVNEETVDLKELMLFVLRKWRVLILAGLIGVVLGCGVGMLKAGKSAEDLSLSELHIDKIVRYSEYQKLHEELVRQETESVYMNMDPKAVFKGNRTYSLTAAQEDMARIGEMYQSILGDEQIYSDLVEASCLPYSAVNTSDTTNKSEPPYSKMDICDLVSISFFVQEDDMNQSKAEASVEVLAPTKEACLGMLELLDQRVQTVNRLVESTYANAKSELVRDVCQVGYDSGVATRYDQSAALLKKYADEINKLEDKLTTDDMLYYKQYQAGDEEATAKDAGMGWLKWGLIVGVLFGCMMAVAYAVAFQMDSRIKNMEELKRVYGLHLIACLNTGKKTSRCPIDRMLTTKPQYNSDAYLESALDAMSAEKIHVCGDMENAQLAAQMKRLEKDGVTVSNRLAVDEKAQQMAKAADGVVLYVQLWNTKRGELLRELEIADQIDARVLGVVVLD